MKGKAMTDPTDRRVRGIRWRILERVTVSKEGFGGLEIRFHPSHDMGSMFCRNCGAWGSERPALRLCPKPGQTEGVGL